MLPPVPQIWPARRLFAWALDLVIAAYSLVLLVSLLTALDLGPLTPDQLEKPILVLLIAVPIRIAVGGRSWLIGLERLAPLAARLRARAVERISPAVLDVLLIVVASRLATFAIAFVANLVFPPGKARAWEMPFEYRRFAEIFAAW